MTTTCFEVVYNIMMVGWGGGGAWRVVGGGVAMTGL